MKFILETKLNNLKGKKLKLKKVSLKNQWEDWCLDNKKECLDEICWGWEETDQGIVVRGTVWLNDKQLKQIPFKFYRVEYGFQIHNNLLISLLNSPKYVEDNFSAFNNKLQNLIGGPRRVNGHYDVSHNQINSLEGAPEYVGKFFYIEEQTPPGKQWTKEEIKEKIEVEGEIKV